MDFGGAKGVPVLCGKFINHELIKDSLDVLEIGHVAPCADDGVIADRMQTLDILETCKGAI